METKNKSRGALGTVPTLSGIRGNADLYVTTPWPKGAAADNKRIFDTRYGGMYMRTALLARPVVHRLVDLRSSEYDKERQGDVSKANFTSIHQCESLWALMTF